jgi:hypothetical protein
MVDLLCYFRFTRPHLHEADLRASAQALNIPIEIHHHWKNTLSLPVPNQNFL